MERVVERGNELINGGLEVFDLLDLDETFGEFRSDLFKQNRIDRLGLYKLIVKGQVGNKLKEKLLKIEFQTCLVHKLKDLGFKNIQLRQKGVIRAHWEGKKGASDKLTQIFPGMKKFSGDLPYGDHIFDIMSMLDKLTPEHIDKISGQIRVLRKDLKSDKQIVGMHISVPVYQFKQLENTSSLSGLNDKINRIGWDMIVVPMRGRDPLESLNKLMNKCRRKYDRVLNKG